MPVERLTAEDQLMLWPDEIWPQEIGALAILDGSSLLHPGGRFRIEAVRDVIAARLHLVPRFRQLLCIPRPGHGGPLWVDAPAFDLSDHVRVVPLPAPGDEAALLLATEQLRRRRLDRSRPLWQMCFLPGFPRTGWACSSRCTTPSPTVSRGWPPSGRCWMRPPAALRGVSRVVVLRTAGPATPALVEYFE
jgi:hypothetical protein